MKNMHISRIDLNLLVVLDAICAEGSITRASEKLNLTQSALSHALARLRTLFDDPLFVREGRAIVPTPLARSLVEPIRRSLHGIEMTLHQAGRFDAATTKRRFTLAIRGMLEMALLPPLMQHIGSRAPGVDIDAVHVSRRGLEESLAMGSIDAAVDVALPLSGHVRRLRVGLSPMVVVVRRDHPQIRDALDLDAYLAQGHVLVGSRRSGPGLADMELGRRDLHRRIRLRCQDYFTGCGVVSRTDLLLTMPQRHADFFNRPFGNRIFPLPLATPLAEAHFYWHANTEHDPANRWLREQVIEACNE